MVRDKPPWPIYTDLHQGSDNTAHRDAVPNVHQGGRSVSIVRIGLAETKNFADGYDAIFGKKKEVTVKKAKADTGKKKKKVKKK
jgi:hypothetical protein